MSDSPFISLERFPYDAPEWHIQISASNGYFAGCQDFYTYSQNLVLSYQKDASQARKEYQQQETLTMEDIFS